MFPEWQTWSEVKVYKRNKGKETYAEKTKTATTEAFSEIIHTV